MSTETDKEIWKEPLIADELGLSRETLLSWRQQSLAVGVHWVQVGRDIVYTEQGRGRIYEMLAAARDETQKNKPKEDAGQPPIVAPSPSGAPVVADFEVVSLPRNPKLLFCRKIGDTAAPGQPVVLQRIRVRSAANFILGMRLKAQHEHDEVWALVGRTPRWKGRW